MYSSGSYRIISTGGPRPLKKKTKQRTQHRNLGRSHNAIVLAAFANDNNNNNNNLSVAEIAVGRHGWARRVEGMGGKGVCGAGVGLARIFRGHESVAMG